MSYDAFAETFSNSRKNLHWPELEYIIEDMRERGYMSILDIGCGNGRFLDWFGNPPLGGGQGGVSSETPLCEGGRGELVPVRDTSGYSHRLPYNRKNTERARELRKNMSSPEKELWYQFLKHQNVRWYRQYPIDNFIVDFYCPTIKCVIEIDGENHMEQIKFDSCRTDILEKYGLRLIRFSNRDVMVNLEQICDVIKNIQNSPLPPSQRGVETIKYFGIDSSRGMIHEARKLHPDHQFEVISMQEIENHPHLRERPFESILLLASFHHLETIKERIQFLNDIRSLLAPNGRIYMTNWNLLGQERYMKSHRGNGDFDIKIGEFSRYYHGFTLTELDKLFRETGYQVIENRIFEGGRNLLSVLEI